MFTTNVIKNDVTGIANSVLDRFGRFWDCLPRTLR